MGGIYANKILLYSTETEVGVHNAIVLNGIAGDVVVNAYNTLMNSGAITTSQSIQMTTTEDINNSDKL